MSRNKNDCLKSNSPLIPISMKKLWIWAGVLLLFTACESKHDIVNTPAPAPQALEATFVSLKQNIFQAKCASCHSSDHYQARGGQWRLDDYNDYVQSFPQILNEVISESMPKNDSPLSALEIQILKDWQKNGFPLESSNQNPIPPVDPIGRIPDPITWEFLNQYVFSKQCLSCHSADHAGERAEGFVYESYNDYKNDFEFVWELIESDEMPQNAEPLSDIEKSLIQLWEKQGFQP